VYPDHGTAFGETLAPPRIIYAFQVCQDALDAAAEKSRQVNCELGQLPRHPLQGGQVHTASLPLPDHHLWQRKTLVPCRSQMDWQKVHVIHLTTTFSVTVLLHVTIILFTLGMRDCNFSVTQRFL